VVSGQDTGDNSKIPDYLQNWDKLEPTFTVYNTEFGHYILDWSWNQDDAEGVTYYLEEAETQDFQNANITTHFDTNVLITGKPNGTYWYRVKGVKDSISSDWSQSESITILIKPIDPIGGIIIHDYHPEIIGIPYLKEKLEFFMNVPMVVQVGDDPNTSVKYTITLVDFIATPEYNISILEVKEPHQYLYVTSEETEIDINLDGENDLTTKFKLQHELGQVYIYFTLIDEPTTSSSSYLLIGGIVVIVLILVASIYLFRMKNKNSTGNNQKRE